MSLPSKYQLLLKRLKNLGVCGIDSYKKRLIDNSSLPDKLQDFYQEGIAALTLAGNGFEVTFSERPDLKVKFEDFEFNAEVKHFRLKNQDKIDYKRMIEEEDFVEYGDTEPTEGQKAWCQVYDALNKKDKVLPSDKPGIIILVSSSDHCVEDAEVMFAVNEINDEIQQKKRNQSSLNGALYIGRWYSHQDQRDTFYYKITSATPSMPDKIQISLNNIKNAVIP
ncbi:hypothetical protein KA005_48575 [bacterium]|nr:hypothetical protein [bacterium]